jgi:hypothetical protein
VITRDVPPGALAVERSEQRNISGYRRRKDAEHATTTGSGSASNAKTSKDAAKTSKKRVRNR